MDKIKPLFAATATVTGGRNGHTEASDVLGWRRRIRAEGDGRTGQASNDHA